MLISPEQEALIGRVFDSYLIEYHHGDILLLIADMSEEGHRSVVVNAMTLFEANMEVGDYFNAYPSDVLAIFDKVLHRRATELSQNAFPKYHGGQKTTEHRMTFTPHTRITGLPVCPELTRDTIPRSRDVGHFLSVTGTVIRTSVAKVLEYEREYMCTKCRHIFTVQADFEQFCTFVQLMVCPKPDGCNSTKFSCLSGGSEPAACRDYQEIKLQEQVQKLSVGSIPRSMVVVLEDDLVDSCKSGDDVTVYGVICQRWKPFSDGARCDVELVLKANNLEVNNQQGAATLAMKDVQKEFEEFWNNYKHDPMAGRNQILLSLCPQVFGMYLIKLAVAMVLAGGVQRIDSSGTKIRGECHMLLVGDPGTGKSQFLKYAAKIMPRSVLTAGIGSTSAGLTVAAVKDGGDWHLEAGALVLSDGGLCCIDEFNSIKEHDRISIHEAMEQQSISVAKAGMVCKLNTRTTILAATNPKGQYNPNEPLSVNVALASPLLSRFDLVLVLMDTKNTEWDRVISSFILGNRGHCAESSSLWTMEKMKAYFSVIKHLQPQVSEEANSILSRYYQLQRQSDDRNTARTTIRMLESLSRLAEAHARLMFRETVTIEDAVMAVSVMECSMQGGALLGNINALLTSFPADPGQQYETQCQILLEGLNLPMVLVKEMSRLARLKSNHPDASPPTDNFHHYLRDTADTNKTHYPDITRNCKSDGLDWFNSITTSLSLDGIASPAITSTQENLNRKSESTWLEMSPVNKPSNYQNEKDIPSSTGTVTSAAEEHRKMKKENMKEKNTLTQGEMKQSERQKDKQCQESLGCVFQKISKNMKDRGLGELEARQQGSEKRHTERVVYKNCESTNVAEVLESHTSSSLSPGKTSLSNNAKQDKLSSGKPHVFTKEDKRDQMGKNNISAVVREKVADGEEKRKELYANLSGFIFKPRNMKSVHNDSLNVSVDVHTDCNSGSNKESRICKPNNAWHTHTERKIQIHTLSKGGSRKKRESCVREVADDIDLPSEELNSGDFTSRKEAQRKTVGTKRMKGKDNSENLSQQQKLTVDTGNQTKIQNSTSNPKPSRSDHMKSILASSTLTKLSRFSFTCTTEPTRGTQTEEERHPPTGEGKSPLMKDCADWRGGNSKDKTTSPEQRLSGEKILPCKLKSSVKVTSGCPMSSRRENQTESTGSASHMTIIKPVNEDPTGNLKKRKCVELDPPTRDVGASRGPFSGLSLFELDHDVLDTNWDQELSKKVKI